MQPARLAFKIANLLMPILWAAWISLSALGVYRAFGWIEDIVALDHRTAAVAYDWYFNQMPFLYLIFGCASGGLIVIFLKRKRSLAIVTFVSLLSGGTLKGLKWYVSDFEHGRLLVRTVSIESPKIKNSIRILHISDLEAAAIGDHEMRALEKVASLGADMVIFTGDLIELQRGDRVDDLWSAILPHLNKIDPPLGFYGVYGDGDGILYRIPVSRESTMQMLGVSPKYITVGETKISVKGLSLYQSRIDGITEQRIEAWLRSVNENVFTILVGHGPDYIPSIQDNPIDLCLAGHTHGGQVNIPFWGPLIVNSEIPKELVRGYHEIGNTRVNISAGLGSDRFRGMPIVRFRCPTEMTLIELLPGN